MAADRVTHLRLPLLGRVASPQRLIFRGAVFLAVLTAVTAGAGRISRAIDDVPGAPYTGRATFSPLDQLQQRLDSRRGDTELGVLAGDRAKAIAQLGARYGVGPELASVIFDAAVAEGLDPELAFRLVKVESNFNPRARSTAAALGLAQVQLPTARYYEPRITEAGLFEPARNLRIGFRYLRDLTDRYGGDLRLALLAYNVGPGRLNEILEGGTNPTGKYAATVLGGFSYRTKTD